MRIGTLDVPGRLTGERADVIASHFKGVGRFVRCGTGFCRTDAKEDGAPVE